MGSALVAIAKNEGRYLAEWISYYLNLGFDEIIIYDNESNDGSAEIIDEISKFAPIKRIFWKNVEGNSPQYTAYNDFLRNRSSRYEWVAYFDLDEFLVIRNGATFKEILGSFPQDVAAVGINWLTYGSSGRKDAQYELVTEAFKWGRSRDFSNNYHIKTLLRPKHVSLMGIHHCEGLKGSYVHPNGELLTFPRKKGVADSIDHSVLQLNHYQIKSEEEFIKKIKRGRASIAVDDAARIRKNHEGIFKEIDKQEELYQDVDMSFVTKELYPRCKAVQDRFLIGDAGEKGMKVGT